VLNSLGFSDLKILLFEDIDTTFADKEKMVVESKLLIEQSENNFHIVKQKFLTYSGLLNALDGAVNNQHGVITIMTTNYIEKLGPAFIRPGCIDLKYELKECNSEQIRAMFTMFLKKHCLTFEPDIPIVEPLDKTIVDKIEVIVKYLVNAKDESKITPCVLQQYMLSHINSIDEMLNSYRELPKQ